MIASSKIGIIGVGEGSTEHFDNFRYAIGESPIDILKKTNGSLKVGVMFKDWTKEPFMVSNQTPITRRAGESLFYIEKLIADGKKQKDTSLDAYWNNTVPKWYADPQRNKNKLVPTLQYHFNTDCIWCAFSFLSISNTTCRCWSFDGIFIGIGCLLFFVVEMLPASIKKTKYTVYDPLLREQTL